LFCLSLWILQCIFSLNLDFLNKKKYLKDSIFEEEPIKTEKECLLICIQRREEGGGWMSRRKRRLLLKK